MGITEFKAIIGIWLLAQIFNAPFFIIEDKKFSFLIMDFGALILLIVMYFGLKLIGV
jgi:hypothetical protein